MARAKRAQLDPLLRTLDDATIRDPLTTDQAKRLLARVDSSQVQDPDTHTVGFPLDRWEGFPPWRDVRAADDAERCLSRGQVVDVAKQGEHSGDWLPTLCASYAWGAALAGYGPYRLHRVLGDVGEEAVRQKLANVVDIMRTDGPVAAYRSLRSREEGSLRIRWLGPAFFTKFLYFAGRVVSTPADVPTPLILDRILAGELRAVARERAQEMGDQNAAEVSLWAWPSGAWFPGRYETYLRWAAAATESLRAKNDTWPERVDAVEVGLFLSRAESAR